MLYTAEKQPAMFFATCARLLPNDVRVTVEQSLPGNLSMEGMADDERGHRRRSPSLLTHHQARCLSMCLRRSGLLMRRS